MMDRILQYWALAKKWRDYANSALGQLVLWAGGSTMAAAIVNLVGPIVGLACKVGDVILDIVGALARSPHGRAVLVALLLGACALYGRHHYIDTGRALQAEEDRATIATAVSQRAKICKFSIGRKR